MISSLKTNSVSTSRETLPADAYYQALWARLQPAENGRLGARVLGFTSSRRREGVSTITANLAVTGAEQGARVLLVDANSVAPAVRQIFSIPQGSCLFELLRSGQEPDSLQQNQEEFSEYMLPSGIANLTILAAEEGSGDLARIPDTAWSKLLRQTKNDFDWVLFDLPALDQGAATSRIASLLDGVAMVVEAERVRREVVQYAKESLCQARAHLLGTVLNKRRQYIPDWLYRIS